MPAITEALPDFTVTLPEFNEFWNQLTLEQQMAWNTASGTTVRTLNIVEVPLTWHEFYPSGHT